ncbi:hypothetical protein [Hyalangium minutum]|uniref:hypothetical protein n=1 Tax=Hyalangium minutum TaxID=394096 RepID=UPI0004E6F44C|nr:hypothetical protein [Hyalangium minutum]
MRGVGYGGRVSTRRLLLPVLLLTVGFSLGCNSFVQNPGHYDLDYTEIFLDDCGLLPPKDPPSLWDGSLLITGQVVRMDFELLEMQLVGRFLASGEKFAVDGSVANAEVPINGQTCLLDQVSVHLEGDTVCATQFRGVLRVRYEARRPDSCVCEVRARFNAVQDGLRCE